MTKPEEDGECPGCGSMPKDREAHGGHEQFSQCPHCGSWKCGMCDMGDDVECPSCDDVEEP